MYPIITYVDLIIIFQHYYLPVFDFSVVDLYKKVHLNAANYITKIINIIFFSGKTIFTNFIIVRVKSFLLLSYLKNVLYESNIKYLRNCFNKWIKWKKFRIFTTYIFLYFKLLKDVVDIFCYFLILIMNSLFTLFLWNKK